MGRFLRLVNGVARSFDESGTPTIYDERLTIVAGAPANSNEMTGPVNAGVNVTLPDSGSYTGLELQIYLNGDRLESVADYAYVGGSPPRTQVQFTFGLVVGDAIDFVIQRAP